MRKLIKLLIFSCLCTSFAGTSTSLAAINLETETSAAGISVVFNNYYAGSMNPEEELAMALSSPAAFTETAQSSPQTDAPRVTATASPYEDVAISRVSNYVNVRTEPNTTSEVVGKIYNNCAAKILKTIDGEGGKWYQIQSGNVTGYIKSEFFVTGTQAESIARQVGTSMARVSNTATLRLREQPSLDSKTLDLLSADAEYEVIGEEGEFLKVSVDTDLQGYVFKDYVDIRVEFDNAVSVEEEKAKEAESQRLKAEADRALAELEKAKEKAKETAAPTTAAATTAPTTAAPATEASTAAFATDGPTGVNPDGSNSGPTAASTMAAPATKAPETTQAPTTAAPTKATIAKGDTSGPGGSGGPGADTSGSKSEVASATRNAVVAYAKQFLGNPYVYGGTSLTNGADCSGFTQGVYKHFGITTGRTSRDQAAKGKEISIDSVQPGDLLFYASGNYINHVAMYIGGGQVIHASTPTTGITISPSNYRTPCKAVTFLD